MPLSASSMTESGCIQCDESHTSDTARNQTTASAHKRCLCDACVTCSKHVRLMQLGEVRLQVVLCILQPCGPPDKH
jgi:hypothetical protein